jgi:glycosyltransferase involved in cell wall biosynthesis
MIVRDEEEVLGRCLDSVKKAVDEIIIVDTGSVDGTKAIARKYTDKVYDFVWVNDFSAARNEAFSKATMDYQMWLDADDVVPEKELEKLIGLKKALDPNAYDMVAMKYFTHFDEQGNPILKTTRERMMKREKGFTWLDPIHEHIPLALNSLYTDIEIHHKKNHKEGDQNRNLNIYQALEESGKELTPRQQYYFARELKDHAMWAKAVYYFERFLNSGKGWVEDNIATCYNLSICYNSLGDHDKILPILTKSFLYDSPRAEICTETGYYYKRAGQPGVALKWFDLATKLGEPESAGFILWDYWGYIPNVEACVCCYELGDFESAKRYNEQAALCKPDSKAVEINRAVLASR